MITWPDSLVREISRRRCVIFSGSGISVPSKAADGSYPCTWREFLDRAIDLIVDSDKRDLAKKIIDTGNLLLGLQAIKDSADQADYHALVTATYNSSKYKPNRLHEILYQLDQRVVITTNFDKIYETYCLSSSDNDVGYKVLSYNNHGLADELRSDARLIIKAHGDINQTGEIVFTRSDYHRAKRDNPEFYTLLRSLFLTSTVVFVGCSMTDPDVNLVLEDVKITSSSRMPHYAIIKGGSVNIFSKNDYLTSYNIKLLEYDDTPDHADLKISLEDLLNKVERDRFSSAIY